MMTNNKDQDPAGKAPNPIRANLEEQFGELRSDEAVPEELKEEVFNTLDSIVLVADLIDLFTVKFTQTEADFLDMLGEDTFFEEEEN